MAYTLLTLNSTPLTAKRATLPSRSVWWLKGSITVNGVSLTVNRVLDSADGTEISINLIPHTVQNTALHRLSTGAKVNLEIDLIARYVERMLRADPSLAPPPP